jgi:hypothetical protein
MADSKSPIGIEKQQVVKRRLVALLLNLLLLLRRLSDKRILLLMLVLARARHHGGLPLDPGGLVIMLIVVVSERGHAAAVALVAAGIGCSGQAADVAEASMTMVMTETYVSRVRSGGFCRSSLRVAGLAVMGWLVLIGRERRAVGDVVNGGSGG